MLNFVLEWKIKNAKTGKHYFRFYGNEKQANKFIIKMNRKLNDSNKTVSYYWQADKAGYIHNIEVIVT